MWHHWLHRMAPMRIRQLQSWWSTRRRLNSFRWSIRSPSSPTKSEKNIRWGKPAHNSVDRMWDHIKRNIPKTLKNRSSLEYENSESMMTYIYIYTLTFQRHWKQRPFSRTTFVRQTPLPTLPPPPGVRHFCPQAPQALVWSSTRSLQSKLDLVVEPYSGSGKKMLDDQTEKSHKSALNIDQIDRPDC